jgi:hypothetical protein
VDALGVALGEPLIPRLASSVLLRKMERRGKGGGGWGGRGRGKEGGREGGRERERERCRMAVNNLDLE